jgi:hypothetical protein
MDSFVSLRFPCHSFLSYGFYLAKNREQKFLVLTISRRQRKKPCDSVMDGYQCENDMSHFWGQYSPYYTVPSAINADVPPSCQITFAQILSRHGARDPTAGKSQAYQRTIQFIQKHVSSYNGHAAFLKNYQYRLGADQLTTFGQYQMINSGIKYFERYSALSSETVPFIRASGQDRVIESALNWTQGFHAAHLSHESSSTPDDHYPYDIIIIPEEDGFNNTLSHGTCPDFSGSPGYEAQAIWASIFTPAITKRLHKLLEGVKLNTTQTIWLMDLCPFETVASPTGAISRFCQLFTVDEWKSYDYYQSLGKYYGYEAGNKLGATQGVGYVNELIARLTNNPVDDHTNTNSTLDGSEDTFPVGRALYADFSHDNDMTRIFAAFGLYNGTTPLSKTSRQTATESDGYLASWTVPFAGRVYFEKMKCRDQEEELVRVVVNDRVLPLETCGGDAEGRCSLSSFVESLSFARQGGNWDKCFI